MKRFLGFLTVCLGLLSALSWSYGKSSVRPVAQPVNDTQPNQRSVSVEHHGDQTSVVVSPAMFQLLESIEDGTYAAPIRVMTPTGSASVSISSPNAFGGDKPTIFAGANYVNHWHDTNQEDGNIGLGLSFGNPFQYVGVSLNVGIDSVGVDQRFDKNGGFGFRLNRYITRNAAIAFGMTNVVGWGAWKDLSKGYYLDLTRSFHWLVPLTINAGAGTGGFYSIDQGQSGSDSLKDIGFFGGAGIEPVKNLSLIADYTTRQLALGGNYTMTWIPHLPIVLGASYINVNENGGAKPYFQASVGISYSF